MDGQPFIMPAAEVHNSSASSLEYLERHVWDKLTDANCNPAIV